MHSLASTLHNEGSSIPSKLGMPIMGTRPFHLLKVYVTTVHVRFHPQRVVKWMTCNDRRDYVTEDCYILYGVQCSFTAWYIISCILYTVVLLPCGYVYMYACVGIHLCDNNIACVVMMQLIIPNNLLLTNLHAVLPLVESCIPVWLIIKHSRHYNYMASSQYNYVWQNEP